MKNRHKNLSIPFICLVFIMSASEARTVEIAGALENVAGQSLSGIITLFHAPPNSIAESHEVEGDFRISTDAEGEILVHVQAPGHPSEERVLAAAVTGRVTMNFRLPLGQDVHGRVVDPSGNGVSGATVRVHYHEPSKPTRKVTFVPDSRTDGNGEFQIRDVGIQVPFYIDVLAPSYIPTQSRRFNLAASETELGDIVLTEPGAVIVVTVLDKAGAAVRGVAVTLFADPASYPETARGSWLFPRAYRQRAKTSSLGNVRFSGVPAGRALLRYKTDEGKAEAVTLVVGGVEFPLTLTVP